MRKNEYSNSFLKDINIEELLKFAVEHGMIDTSYVQEQIEMSKREELLKKHPYSITQGRDGRWITYLPDQDKGRKMIRKKEKAELEGIIIDFWKTELENPTVSDVFHEWMENKKSYKDICAGTCDRYKRDFNRFFEDDTKFSQKRIKDISPSDIKPFIRGAIAKYSLTAKAYGNLRTLIYGIFKYAKEKEYISWSISQTIGDMEIPRKAFRKVIKEDDEEVFTDEEMEKLINYLTLNPTVENLGIIIMFCTGVRVGELVGIRWEDVTGNSIKIRRTEISYQKESGGKIYEIREYPKTEAGIRTVYVPDSFTNVLDKLRELTGNQECMLSYEDGRNMKTEKVRKQLYTVCEKIGVRKKSPHKLRKTYISILLDNGVDRRLVQDVAGHTEIATSERNYHRNRKSDAKKEEILSNLPEFKNVAFVI